MNTETPYYAIAIYTFFALNFIMCLVSIVSKNKKKDGVIHCILPILLLVVSYLASWAFEISLSPYWNIYLVFIFIMIIVSFVKRANVFNDNSSNDVNVVVKNTTDADELKKYKELLDSGVISQEEFVTKKKQLLG